MIWGGVKKFFTPRQTRAYFSDGPRETAARARMVREQIEARGVRDPRLLEAMAAVPRHLFVPPTQRAAAHADEPVGIGHGQTISQPYVVAAMIEPLRLMGSERVLEIGTGSGYQTAVLARLAAAVFSVEINADLAENARALLKSLGHENAFVRTGDGWDGWPDKAPFDAVIVAAGTPDAPDALLNQLADGGRLVMPQGPRDGQILRLWTKNQGARTDRTLFPVRFVPVLRATGEPRD